MANPTVRISQKAHRTLKDLAARSGQPMQDILDAAIEEEYRRRFVEEANRSYARLRQDADAWAAVEQEREDWDGTLLDGLKVSEPSPSGKSTSSFGQTRKKRRGTR